MLTTDSETLGGRLKVPEDSLYCRAGGSTVKDEVCTQVAQQKLRIAMKKLGQ